MKYTSLKNVFRVYVHRSKGICVYVCAVNRHLHIHLIGLSHLFIHIVNERDAHILIFQIAISSTYVYKHICNTYTWNWAQLPVTVYIMRISIYVISFSSCLRCTFSSMTQPNSLRYTDAIYFHQSG